MCYGARVEDPGKVCGVPASVRGSIAWILFLGVLGWFIYICTQNRDLFPQAMRVGFLAGVWSLAGLVLVFSCSYSLYPGRVAGDDTLHAVVNHSTTSRIEGNYEIRTHHTWYVTVCGSEIGPGPVSSGPSLFFFMFHLQVSSNAII